MGSSENHRLKCGGWDGICDRSQEGTADIFQAKKRSATLPCKTQPQWLLSQLMERRVATLALVVPVYMDLLSCQDQKIWNDGQLNMMQFNHGMLMLPLSTCNRFLKKQLCRSETLLDFGLPVIESESILNLPIDS